MASVFISYSHKDEELRQKLETHLAGLRHQGVISTWHDRRIVPGQDIHGRISAQIDAADIILLLISSDFLESDYCYNIEMRRALEKHEGGTARIIPVILRPCDWQAAPFGNLNAVPTDGRPITKHGTLDDAFLYVARAVRQVAESIDGDGSSTVDHSNSVTVACGSSSRRTPFYQPQRQEGVQRSRTSSFPTRGVRVHCSLFRELTAGITCQE